MKNLAIILVSFALILSRLVAGDEAPKLPQFLGNASSLHVFKQSVAEFFSVSKGKVELVGVCDGIYQKYKEKPRAEILHEINQATKDFPYYTSMSFGGRLIELSFYFRYDKNDSIEECQRTLLFVFDSNDRLTKIDLGGVVFRALGPAQQTKPDAAEPKRQEDVGRARQPKGTVREGLLPNALKRDRSILVGIRWVVTQVSGEAEGDVA